MPIEYAKRVQAKAALESTSWHNDMLALSESIILNHAAALTSLRRQLYLPSNHGKDNSGWLHEVESFIDEVIEASGAHVRSSPELLRAVRWMIASATAQYALPSAPVSQDSESAVVQSAA
jgi:aspartyl/asparaginyl beta-hydroxylase (cupin superfamily)